MGRVLKLLPTTQSSLSNCQYRSHCGPPSKYWHVDSTDYFCTHPILGAFAKLRKATISLVMSICPSVRPSLCLFVYPLGTTQLPKDGFSW